MEVIKKGRTIQSLQIGMGIVDLIAKQGRPLKSSDIDNLTEISKSNLYKYLHTFTQLGILDRDKESGAYVLGSKLIEYGLAAVGHENVVDRITPYLQEINEKSLSTVVYSTWTHNGPMIIREFYANQGYNIGAQTGTLLPLLSATGKVFMAFMDEQITREWRKKELKKTPSKKINNLKEECKLIYKKEISFAREPLVPFVSSIAFPVFNYKKQLLGTVTIVGFSELIPQNEDEELSRILMSIGKEISGSFGYEPHIEPE